MRPSPVARRALITNLHAPSTQTQPLDHLVRVLTAAGADQIGEVAELTRFLRETADLLHEHNTIAVERGRTAGAPGPRGADHVGGQMTGAAAATVRTVTRPSCVP